jgi:plastocyanin
MKRRGLLAALLTCALWPTDGAGHGGHGSTPVDIGQFEYRPAELVIYRGDMVNWVWRGPDTDHSVTAEPGQAEQFDSDPDGPPGVDTHAVGDNFTHTFTRTGRFTYRCRVHAFMTGAVVVKEPSQGGPRDRRAPAIRSLKVRPRVFCVGRGCPKPKVKIRLSERASLNPDIQRRRRGRWKLARDLPLMFLRKGRNRERLPVRGLKPGRYRLVGYASDAAGNDSRNRRARFRVRG